ncbi:MAG TPA: ATP-binding cassette domain-containing protein [Bryobacteraceae bacterium]|nr:ATP-binding cassette domain-containing protein [Bryobacteraceae bacterium]
MIQVQDLSKSFTDSKRGTRMAVDRVSFEVHAGEVFGLLGPNGAGKTTTLRLIATLLKPSSGTATLNGFDINKEPGKVREQIGFLSGDMGLYARLTPREILEFFGKLNGMANGRRTQRINDLFSLFDMQSFADVRTDKLSTGMKQKTAIARTMLHDPPILILDEPTSGLDVPTARTIETAIVDAKHAGKCIVYSTHVMEEAEYLCDRIAVINDGQLKMTGTMDQLRTATGKHRLREIFLDLLGLPPDK